MVIKSDRLYRTVKPENLPRTDLLAKHARLSEKVPVVMNSSQALVNCSRMLVLSPLQMYALLKSNIASAMGPHQPRIFSLVSLPLKFKK